ncbi:MAG: acetyl-CoA carboxylase biotin carboxyl carrier protein subunit [Firmicutes bacterium]|nr:acetyl-CoA carboxylase biotin carboxyl carrier protein subunit [Bacillota bacterium]
METYVVRINGNEYEVEIERKDGASAPAAAPAAKPAAAPAKPAAAAPAAAPAAAGSGEPVICGTAGKVWKIVAKEGDTVSTGDTILILEAMKMEIPVVSPVDGTVGQIIVSEGDSTESGQTVAYVS